MTADEYIKRSFSVGCSDVMRGRKLVPMFFFHVGEQHEIFLLNSKNKKRIHAALDSYISDSCKQVEAISKFLGIEEGQKLLSAASLKRRSPINQ